jgi:hypothetical protein
MIRSQAVEIISRRLGLHAGRVAALVQRCADAHLLPKATGRSIPELGALELARLFLAAVCDNGLGNAATSVTEFSALQTERGVSLIDVFEGLFAGRASATAIRSAVFQLEPAGAVLIGGHHLAFGAPLSTGGAARHVIVPGASLSAICFELRGAEPDSADEQTAVARLSAALH